MIQIERCLQELVSSIVVSDSYRDFEKAKEALASHPEARQRLDEYRKKNFILQSRENDPDLFEKVEALSEEYAELQKDPRISDYLEAELSICRMVQTITDKVVSEVNLELDFLEETTM